MSINIPTAATEVEARAKTDVSLALDQSNPFLKNSWLGSLVTAFSNRVYDFYLQLNVLLLELFWNTSGDEFLEIQANWFGVTRLSGAQATGSMLVSGTGATAIPLGTEFKSSDGIAYLTTLATALIAGNISITALTRSGQTATATVPSTVGMAANVQMLITGVVEPEYDGLFTIQVISPTQFTYTIVGTPTTPATGTIVAAWSVPRASIPVQSTLSGFDKNQVLDTPLTITTPIAGLDNTANVEFIGISGGADQELTESLRTRFLDRVQNPVAMFNDAAITAKAKEVNGVTRVFIQDVTPAIGQVTIHFMRDNDTDPIPSAGAVTTTKNKILEIVPATTAAVDVIVAAPVAVPTAFTFSSITPDTATMRTAITANLKQFFSETPKVGVDVDQDAFRAAIFATVDTATGGVVSGFALATPVADITIIAGEIGTLGAVTYP